MQNNNNNNNNHHHHHHHHHLHEFVVNHKGKSNNNCVAIFPSGAPNDITEMKWAVSDNNNSNNSVITGDADAVEYRGVSNGTYFHNDGTKYIIGLKRKGSNKIELFDVGAPVVFQQRIKNNLSNPRNNNNNNNNNGDDDGDDDEEKFTITANTKTSKLQLVTAFGSTKAMRLMENATVNAVNASNLNAKDHIAAALHTKAAEQGDNSNDNNNAALAPSYLPTFHINGETPAEIYVFDDIVSPDDASYLVHERIAKVTSSADVKNLNSDSSIVVNVTVTDGSSVMIKKALVPDFILRRIEEALKMTDKKKKKQILLQLQYLHLLISFYNIKEAMMNNKDGYILTGIPKYFWDTFLNQFTESQSDFEKRLRRTKSKAAIAKLTCYIIVIALIAFDYEIHIVPIAESLFGVELVKFKLYVKQVGCTINDNHFKRKANQNDEKYDLGSEKKDEDTPRDGYAKLTAPLTFPTARKQTPKRK